LSNSLNKHDVLEAGFVALFSFIGKEAPNLVQGGSNMTVTDLYVNKPHCAAAVRP